MLLISTLRKIPFVLLFAFDTGNVRFWKSAFPEKNREAIASRFFLRFNKLTLYYYKVAMSITKR
jgi:hypothetical protein